jgi:hypothetical protein
VQEGVAHKAIFSPKDLNAVEVAKCMGTLGLELGVRCLAGPTIPAIKANQDISNFHDWVADTARTSVRRGVRGITEDPLLAQNLGDAAYAGVYAAGFFSSRQKPI